MHALDTWVDLPQRDTASPLLMPIDKVMTITGRGTVVVGTIKQGMVKKDSKVQVMTRPLLVTSMLPSITKQYPKGL